jgi:hypothetical protein
MAFNPVVTNDPHPGQTSHNDVIKALTLSEYTVSTVPPAAGGKNRIIVVTNGNAGARCLAVSDGTNWLRVNFGAAVNATT